MLHTHTSSAPDLAAVCLGIWSAEESVFQVASGREEEIKMAKHSQNETESSIIEIIRRNQRR